MNAVAEALARYRLIVCVGTGGVGKTTISAALALAAAQRGRRAMVLTIDPARALARALGLAELTGESQRVAVDAPGTLSAGMLDQKRAWDALVARHAPTPAIAAELFANPFYQRLSTSFAGSTEYIAIEELCRLAESAAYDQIVLDTPPAAHALDFLNAPERIDRLFARESSLLATPYRAAWRSAGATARFVLRRLERATGTRTLREISGFFVALDALVDAVRERSRTARRLLQSGDVAFTLVAGPAQLQLEETAALAAKLRARAAPLAAIVVNRVHETPAIAPQDVTAAFAALGDDAAARWLRARWDDAVAEAEAETATIESLATVARGVPIARISDAGRDLHALADLAAIAAALYQPSSATTMPVVAINPPAALSP